MCHFGLSVNSFICLSGFRLPALSSAYVFRVCLCIEEGCFPGARVYQTMPLPTWLAPTILHRICFLAFPSFTMFRYFTVCKTFDIKTDENLNLEIMPTQMAAKETWTKSAGRKKPLNRLDLSEYLSGVPKRVKNVVQEKTWLWKGYQRCQKLLKKTNMREHLEDLCKV